MVNSPVPSEHASDLAEGYTDEQVAELKADADAEATAFKTEMRGLLSHLNELYLHQLDADIQPGNPDSDEFMRLTEVREDILDNRRTALRLRDTMENTVADFAAYRKTLPATNPTIRGPVTRRYNQYMAEFRVDEQRHTANAHVVKMTQLLETCNGNLAHVRAQIDLARVAATAPPDAEAAPAADADDGADVANAASAHAPAITETHRRRTEFTRTDISVSSAKDKDHSGRTSRDVDKDFGDSTLPHAPAASSRGRSGGNPLTPDDKRDKVSSTGAGGNPSAVARDTAHPDSSRSVRGNPLPSRDRDTESIFGPFGSDIAVSSSSTSGAASTPLAFTADGTSLLPATDTGPDFSRYGSNPFYIHSVIKLPIPVDVTYTSTKEPLVSQTQLQPLPPESFNGNFAYWPRFRDSFIRLVHAPGRYMSDADRLRYLVQALKGDALAIAAGYNPSHGEGNYHHVTAALEEEFYRPFQACKVLHQEFLQLKPRNGTTEALRHFAEDTVTLVRLLRDYNDDLNRDRLAIEAWMEKIPNQTRLEMCRSLGPDPELTLEDAVRTLRRVVRWQTNAAIFSSSCGLGNQVLHGSSGNPRAITAGPSQS
ncbi:hypothetical protein AAVH_43394, partial [Aphelenchoides avenae]